VIEKLLRETAGFPERPPDTMPQTAVIPFNSLRIFFPNNMIIILKDSNKTIPFVWVDYIITDILKFQLIMQFLACLDAAFTPNIGYYLSCSSMISINQPDFILFFAHISPKFIHFQLIVMCLFWSDGSMNTFFTLIYSITDISPTPIPRTNIRNTLWFKSEWQPL